MDHNNKDYKLWIQSNGTLTSEQQHFGPNLRAPLYRSTGRDVIYVPSYYEERKRSMQAEKRAEMATRAKIRMDLTIVQPGMPCSDMEVEGLRQGESNGTDEGVSAHEQPFNAYITNVTHDDYIDSLSNLQVLKHNNDTTSLSPLEGIDSKLMESNLESMKYRIKEPDVARSGSDKGSLEEFNVESNAGDLGSNDSFVKPAPIQCKAISNEKTPQAPTQVTESQNPRVLIQSSQPTAEIVEQPTNVRTWKRILRQPSPKEARVQFELERKRKQSTINVVSSEFLHKCIHVSQQVQYSNKLVVEAIEQLH